MLQLFCETLDVTDLDEVVPTLQRLTVMADAHPHLEQVHCSAFLHKVVVCEGLWLNSAW